MPVRRARRHARHVSKEARSVDDASTNSCSCTPRTAGAGHGGLFIEGATCCVRRRRRRSVCTVIPLRRTRCVFICRAVPRRRRARGSDSANACACPTRARGPARGPRHRPAAPASGQRRPCGLANAYPSHATAPPSAPPLVPPASPPPPPPSPPAPSVARRLCVTFFLVSLLSLPPSPSPTA